MEHQEARDGHVGQSNEMATWDSEEDHLLSYFLGDTTASHPTSSASNTKYGADFSNLTISQSRSIAPTTPAVPQFYSSSSKSVPWAAPVESASSSSSSLSSMAATLVNGGPVLHQIAPRPSKMMTSSPPSISPISPAATMGTPQEQLMLPPPPRNKTEEDRQQHIAWLNQINTMAMINANNNTHGGAAPATTTTAPSTAHSMVLPTQHQQLPSATSVTLPVPHHFPSVTFRAPPPPESEEKRARRLARNRESARQSRRRKKERLATLSKKVNGLYNEIEEERRTKLKEMEDSLQTLLNERVQQPQESFTTTSQVRDILDELGPNCPIRQTAVFFQYPALRQLIVPKYQLFMLWLTIQRDDFFTVGKEEFAKRETASRTNSRVSSKQIGEELTNEWKRGEKKQPKKKATTSASASDDGMDDEEEPLKASASDPARFWPLFCFDMSISVDQEEKLLLLHSKKVLSKEARVEVTQASNLVINMKRGILNHLQSTAGRNEHLFLGILRPDQSSKFMKWYASKKEAIQAKKELQKVEADKDITMSAICERLNEVLKLPSDVVKTENEN